MFGYNNLCHTDKCCVCAKSCLDPMQRIDRPDFILADKAILEQRLNYIDEYAFNNSEKMNIRSVLCQMKREERETKEKEKMVSIKTVDIKKEKAKARDEGYKAGLEEAWEIARKIELCLQTCGYTHSQLMAIFNSPSPNEILEKLTIHEVKEKIAAYEEEQAKPKLGDVVTLKCLEFYSDYDTTGIYISESAQYFNLLIKTDAFIADTIRIGKNIVESIEKTSKHFDIQSMLDELG